LLDGHGFVLENGSWVDRHDGSLYSRARIGQLAERDWRKKARVRITRDQRCGTVDPRTEHTFRVGEEETVLQWGRAGHAIDADEWWTDTDSDDVGYVLDADGVEVLELLEHRPATWNEAAMNARQIADALATQAQAREAGQAWEDAGLLVAMTHHSLEIRTGGDRRLVGQVRRDYRTGPCTHPYEVVLGEKPDSTFPEEIHRTVRALAQLPVDPVDAVSAPGETAGTESAATSPEPAHDPDNLTTLPASSTPTRTTT
jgi:hypothetical protein